MKLCEYNHNEVCHNSKECPVCQLSDEKNSEITDLNDKIFELEKQIDDLKEQLEGPQE